VVLAFLGRALIAGAGIVVPRAARAITRVLPAAARRLPSAAFVPAPILRAVRRFRGQRPSFTPTKSPIRGVPAKPTVPKPVVASLPRRIAGLPKRALGVAAGGALAGGAFLLGEEIARRKLFKEEAPRADISGGGAIPRGQIDTGGGLPPGTAPGALIGGAVGIARTRGRVGATVGLLSTGARLARRAAFPAAAGAGVAALGGTVFTESGQPVAGFRRVKRSRIGFKRSDLKAFNRVISTAKRVKKILTKAGMGRTFRSTSGVGHATLARGVRHVK